MRLRLLVVARLIGAWAAALALLLLFFGCWDLIDFYKHNRGMGMSLWLIKLLTMVSVPLVGLASVICFAVPQSIASHPFLWTFVAVIASSIAAFSVANLAGLFFLSDGVGPLSHRFFGFYAPMAANKRDQWVISKGTSPFGKGPVPMLTLSDKWAPFFRSIHETGMGYVIVSVILKDGRQFDRVCVVGGTITKIKRTRI